MFWSMMQVMAWLWHHGAPPGHGLIPAPHGQMIYLSILAEVICMLHLEHSLQALLCSHVGA